MGACIKGAWPPYLCEFSGSNWFVTDLLLLIRGSINEP